MIKDTKKLIDEIVQNGGATLNNELENANLNGGYMVSMVGHETIISLEDLKDYKQVEKTLIEYKKLARKNKAFIGAWINNNKLYLDLSKNYKRLGNAMKIGKKNNQLAIFDINNLEEIML